MPRTSIAELLTGISRLVPATAPRRLACAASAGPGASATASARVSTTAVAKLVLVGFTRTLEPPRRDQGAHAHEHAIGDQTEDHAGKLLRSSREHGRKADRTHSVHGKERRQKQQPARVSF